MVDVEIEQLRTEGGEIKYIYIGGGVVVVAVVVVVVVATAAVVVEEEDLLEMIWM
jgi:F0F1-type ATP synthase epsilon subunit